MVNRGVSFNFFVLTRSMFIDCIVGSSPPPALSSDSSRSSSRADRRLRFAELSPQDVHVYDSAPPSPKKKALALPVPMHDGSEISLSKWTGKKLPDPLPPQPTQESEPAEGSAEYIRRRFFPDAPQDNPDLAWMGQSALPSDTDVTSSLRFDLSGKPISPSLSSSLPTHLGLHHHAEGAHAGYTLDDIFLLSRSTVPAQRATMLAVLARIAQRVSKMLRGDLEGMGDLVGKEEELRKRIVAAGIEAMSERGSVGARAIEVIWQCVVGWDEEISSIHGVELEVPNDATLNSLRLEFFLPQATALLSQGQIVQESKTQLLGILKQLAQQGNEFAAVIATTPRLVDTVVRTFLLPSSSPDSPSIPDPLALDLLAVLASASRINALALREAADANLRFVAILPPASMYPASLATSLLTSTLRFYKVLATYGLYAHIASIAMTEFTQLGQYILSDTCKSRKLMVAWTDLLESWTVCAVDPHQTTPGHEILWSQITGWGWNGEINNLIDRLGTKEGDWDTWTGTWKVNAAWLEGARINGIRGGSEERMECIEVSRPGFEDGNEKVVVANCLDAIKHDLLDLSVNPLSRSHLPHLQSLARHATTLSTAMRLWLACLPPPSDASPVSPPFPLPVSEIANLCAKILVHPVWSLLSPTTGVAQAYVYLRSLSLLLSTFLRLSKRLLDTSKALWAAQALSILTRLLPGDDEYAYQVLGEIFDLLTPGWIASLSIQLPSAIHMSTITPFLEHTLGPRDIYVGPYPPTPRSLLLATTLRLPPRASLQRFGLPLPRAWTLTPIDHLLRSGSSDVFKSLPASWDATEIDIARASLLLTNVTQAILGHFSLTDFLLSREEATFGCMKVFMLEHGQLHADSTNEVFRDHIVGQLMDDILKPHTVSAIRGSSASDPVVCAASTGDLEKVAATFLGQTPFFQYYTDFVSLYDAVSFSHALFARLLLPPTSMRYAIDYRKHLWNDFGHVVKTIRTPVDQVICADIGEYLWPIERDPQMIGAYLRSILKEDTQGFVRLMALHHVAANIWLRDEEGWSDERASKLLRTIVGQGSHRIVRDIVRYYQTTGADILEPPECFGILSEGERACRLHCATRWGLDDRLGSVFDAE